MSFKDFNFKTFIQEALDEIKFKEPTPVQQKLIPVVRSGRDLVGESKTGSGKTHTFLLPIFEKLNPKSGDVQVVITAPSRELATQIYQATNRLLNTLIQKFVLLTMWVVQTSNVRLRNSR